MIACEETGRRARLLEIVLAQQADSFLASGPVSVIKSLSPGAKPGNFEIVELNRPRRLSRPGGAPDCDRGTDAGEDIRIGSDAGSGYRRGAEKLRESDAVGDHIAHVVGLPTEFELLTRYQSL